MRTPLVVILFIMAQANLYTQGPVFSCDIKTVDYGTIYSEDDDGKRQFEFTNTGDFPLIIPNVRTSCGCLVARWPKEPIKPGESGIIETYYAINRIGRINKYIVISTNEIEGSDENGDRIYKYHVIKVDGYVIEGTKPK